MSDADQDLGREFRTGLVIIIRVVLGCVALFAVGFGWSAFFWSGGRSLVWPVCVVVALVSGWLAARGLPLK